MEILFDIVHPAHVHFFKHIISGLQERGHDTAVVARDKDVTLALLDHYGFDFTSIGRSGPKSRFKQFQELISRDFSIWRVAQEIQA